LECNYNWLTIWIGQIFSTESKYLELLQGLKRELKCLAADKDVLKAPEGAKIVQASHSVDSIVDLQSQFLGELQRTRRSTRPRTISKKSLGANPFASLTESFITSPDASPRGSPKISRTRILSGSGLLLDETRMNAILDVFNKYTKFFALYITYVTCYQSATLFLTSEGKSDRYYGKTKGKKGLLELFSKLILPIQRIPRYVLLLRELRKRSQTISLDIQGRIDKALQDMKDIAGKVNKAMERFAKSSEMMELEQKLWDTSIIAPHRSLSKVYKGTFSPILESDFGKKMKKYHSESSDGKVVQGSLEIRDCKAILFNDMLLLAVPMPTVVVYVSVAILEGKNLVAMDYGESSDPYTKVYLRQRNGFSERVGKTETKKRTLNPVWVEGRTAQKEAKGKQAEVRAMAKAILAGESQSGKSVTRYSESCFNFVARSKLNQLGRIDFVIWDEDYLSSDDYMGTASINLLSKLDPKKIIAQPDSGIYTNTFAGWLSLHGSSISDVTKTNKKEVGEKVTGQIRVEVAICATRAPTPDFRKSCEKDIPPHFLRPQKDTTGRVLVPAIEGSNKDSYIPIMRVMGSVESNLSDPFINNSGKELSKAEICSEEKKVIGTFELTGK